MRKYLILSSFLLIISSLSIIGYIVVDAKQEITLETNILNKQKENELYLTPYGYTMEDANVILNPYPVVMSDKLDDIRRSGIDYILLSFYGENMKGCEEIFNMYKSGVNSLEKFTRGHFYRGAL